MTRHNTKISKALLLPLFILLLAGCGKKTPQSNGRSDLQALGIGLGQHLADALEPNSKVLLLGTPGTLDLAKEMEDDTIQGLVKTLQKKNIELQQISYTEEEIKIYYTLQQPNLAQETAAPALQRHLDDNVKGIVILLGQPYDWADDLPPESVVACVDWSGSTELPAWVDSVKTVLIATANRNGNTTRDLQKKRIKDDQQALAWFNKRFSIISTETGEN